MASMLSLLLALAHTVLFSFKSRCHLALENLARRQQLAMLKQSVKRPRGSLTDRLFWELLLKYVEGWRTMLHTLHRYFRKLLKGLRYAPRQIVTDKLRSYGAAHKEALPDVIHDSGKWQNYRAENSHQPTRQQERQMRRFKSPGQAQHFL
jgi:hypothetical protein